jgi:cytochrome c peroxidase
MHDGRFETLEEVIEHYSTGVHLDSPNLAPNIFARASLGPFPDQLKQDLLAFLALLNDPGFTTDPELSDPFAE